MVALFNGAGTTRAMSTIRVLPEEVASQIAAGEVIERPASIVKELLENSIDAGANRIFIKIEKGGKALIKVSDNGIGMSRDDLLLCVERHATSKIEKTSDLFCVRSLGFRGEAIPSIASVSRMQITSRVKDQLAGHRLRIEGGKLISIEETGAPPGTVVEARVLFFNVPARRKFLRAVGTETGHIVDTLVRAALPFPRINFRLEDVGKTILSLSASDGILPRLSALMGRNVAEAVIEKKGGNDDLIITAYLAPSDLARSRGDRLFVYVNSRSIRDRLVTRAIMEGYGQRLMKGQYPQAVLFIEIDPTEVDVNVHPTKQEVRFHNSRIVYQAVASTIEKALSQTTRTFGTPEPGFHRLAEEENVASVSEPAWGYAQIHEPLTYPAGAGSEQESFIKEGPQAIGQLGNTYILCQVKDGLLIVDQHAAHERVMYENLKRQFQASQIEAQALVFPFSVELNVKEKRIALEKMDRLSRFGIELDHFGGNTFLLRSVPALLSNAEWDTFISELIAELGEGETDEAGFLDKTLKIMACHGALRAGHSLTRDEMTHLVRQLEEMDLPTNCPHGRPIFKHLTFREIEKMFRRIV
jgi:DNA mismatch repair protein MutL